MSASGSPLVRAYLAIEELERRLRSAEEARHQPIAVVGLGCRFPGGKDPAAFWKLLREGGDGIREIPADRFDVDAYYDPDPAAPGGITTRSGGFLDDVAGFDAPFFGISPREAASLDPQQRLLLEVAWEALEDAGRAPSRLSGSAAGVFVGIMNTDFLGVVGRGSEVAGVDTYTATGNGLSFAAGRLSYVLGLQGPSLAVDTACSSSAVAVHLACQSLRAGECDLAIAGGVNLLLSPEPFLSMSRLGALSPDGRCKTFSAEADGYGRGEGCGLLVLRRLADAERDGDTIRALILGSAVGHDGPSGGLTVPSGPAQQLVVRKALAAARVLPARVDYLEAHGTGTPLGDPIEVHAAAAVYGEGRDAERPLLLGAVKANVGHLESAAGAASLVKVVLALSERTVPPHPLRGERNPRIDWDRLPVELPVAARPWPAGEGSPLAAVSSFGLSGINAHLVLAGAPRPAERVRTAPERSRRLLVLSGRTETARAAVASRWAVAMAETAAPSLADVAFTAGVGRSPFAHRLAIVASPTATAGTLARSLEAFGRGERPPEVREASLPPGSSPPRVAFLFTGQGSQYPGMGKELYDGEPVVRAILDRCEEAVADLLPERLLSVMFGRDAALLSQTAYTQPALYALEVAVAELWRSWGIVPAALLGHSIGELAAAAVAGVFGIEEGARLVATRGRLMQSLPHGGMAAVLASEDRIAPLLADPRLGRGVSLAAVNGPENVTIAGEPGALAALLRELTARRISFQELAVSHAFHSGMMEPILGQLEEAARAAGDRPPRIPVVSNLAGRVEGTLDAAHWRRHAREAVRFADGIRCLAGTHADLFLEVGPAPTLLGLGRRIVKGDASAWLASLERGKEPGETLLASLGSLFLRGAGVDFEGLERGRARRRVPMPTTPFERERHWPGGTAGRRKTPFPAGAPSRHPLLGEERRPVLREVVFESVLSAASPAFLADHRVGGEVVVPAAALLEMLLAAGAAAGDGRAEGLRLSSVVILRPLALGAEGGTNGTTVRTVRTVATPGSGGRIDVRIEARGTGGSFETIAEGQVGPDDGLGDRQVTGEWEVGRGVDPLAPVDLPALYASLERAGLSYGPAFRTLVDLRAGGSGSGGLSGEASGRVEAREGAGHGFLVPPTLLDGAFHALVAAGGGGAGPQGFLPSAFGALRFLERPGRCAGVAARLVRDDEGRTSGELRLLDPGTGRLLVELLGIRAAPAKRETPAPVDDLLYEVAWREVPLPAANAEEIVERCRPRLLSLPGEFPLGDGPALGEGLEALARGWARKGVDAIEGLSPSGPTPARPGRERLRGRLRELAAGWTGENPETLQEELEARFPAGRSELGLLGRCGRSLPAVLRGEVDPLSILFPKEAEGSAANFYGESPFSRALNLLLARVASEAAHRSRGAELRVLEVGGGTGASTAAILEALPRERTRYLFTDISSGFLAVARGRFGDHPGFATALFDVERSAQEQGLVAGFDLVVAANVLHATADLAATIAGIRPLLSPGGALVLLEGTHRQGWLDVVFGLTDGWWAFRDHELRPDHPLVPAATWVKLLGGAGFESAAALPGEGDEPALGAAVVVALASGREVDRRPWILLGPPREGLAQALSARGVESSTVPSSADLPEALARFRPAGVVFDAGWETEPASAASLRARTDSLSLDLLSVVRALAASEPPPRLVIATSGAVSTGREVVLDPGAAPLVGLGKVIALEHPGLRPLRVDLDPAGPADRGGALLAAEILSGGPDDEVAWRGRSRLVPRLVRRATEARLVRPATPSVRLTTRRHGLLDELALVSAERRAPGPGEVEIEVEAAGLNFLDVMNALGVLPPEVAALAGSAFGGEAAGRIVRTGPGAGSAREGERVVAIGAGSFATHLTTDSRLVAPIPEALGFAGAATIPIAFLTAEVALAQVAALSAGQTVLVHSAAGGVGLAALQLARRLGATVIGTAGSEEKRDLLRAMGVAHVFDSRSLSFAGAVREATGGRGVDVVLNSLAGDFIPAGLSVVARGGAFVEIGKTGVWSGEQAAGARSDVRYTVVALDRMIAEEPAAVGDLLRELVERFAAGELLPLRHRRFDLEDAVAAFRTMQRGTNVGKLVLAPREGPVRRGGTYLVTGGLGGLGLELARWLAARGAGRIVLAGRRGDAGLDPAGRALLAALRDAGTAIETVAADVALPADADRIVALAAGDPASPLVGVFHAAGVLADGVLLEADPGAFFSTYPAKLDGAFNLHLATRKLALDDFVLFSSAAGLLGSAGQGNHAAANAFLDTFAPYLRLQGVPATSIDWGVWGEVGAAARVSAAAKVGVEDRAGRLGLRAFPPAAGIAALERVLSRTGGEAAVLAVDWGKVAKALRGERVPPLLEELVEAGASEPGASPRASEGGEGALGLLAELEGLPAGKRRAHLARRLAEEAAAVLGLPRSRRPDPRQPLAELGLDSLMAVELRNRLGSLLGRTLPATLLFDYPTVERLVGYIGESLPGLGLEEMPGAGPEAAAAPLSASEPIAIVGIGCRFPGGGSDVHGTEAYWKLLLEGVDATCEVPPGRWDAQAFLDTDPDAPGKMVTCRGGFLHDVDLFDAAFFGISPREASAMDPQQRLLLEVAWEALEDAGHAPDRLAGSDTGVFVGICNNDYALLGGGGAAGGRLDAYSGTGTAFSVAAGRISYVLGLQGPSVAIDTACSSSLVALHLAAQSLRSGECRMALAGGVNLVLSPLSMVALSRLRLLSPTGRCRTFDAGADGTARGEGCGIVVLRRLSDALADGDRVLAVIRGSAVNQDGRSSGLTAPNGPAQEAVIRRALAQSGIDPARVGYVEAHGTATPLGDPIEVGALRAVLTPGRPATRPLVVGSVKTNFGHLEAAAGVAGLVKTVLALRHATIPPHLHLESLNPHLDLDGAPIVFPTVARPWEGDGPRVAGVSSFGFSGTNAHVILEEGTEDGSGGGRESAPAPRPLLLPLSTRSATALALLARLTAERLDGMEPGEFPDACFTAAVGRAQLRHRLAVVASDPRSAAASLRSAAEGRGAAGLFAGVADPAGAEGRDPAEDAQAGELPAEDLEQIASLWVRGVPVDLERSLPPGRYRRVSLPTNPFERERFWIDESPRGEQPVRDVTDGGVALLEVAWRRSDLPAPAAGARLEGRWLVVAGDGPLSTAVKGSLEARGAAVSTASTAALAASSADALAASLGSVGAMEGVLFLGALDGDLPEDRDGSPGLSGGPALGTLLHLVQGLARAGASLARGLVVVTRAAVATTSVETVSPFATAVWGLARTIALEHPELAPRRVDLGPEGDVAGILVAELLAGESAAPVEADVAWRRSLRFAGHPVSLRQPLPAAPLALRPEGRYLVTGGLGALGLEVARRLVERGARHLTLASRGEPSAAALDLVASLEAAGARLSIVRGDVASEKDVARMVTGEPPLLGIVHAAGTVEDGILPNQTLERFERVLSPKVRGGLLLDRLAGERLEFMVFFSSVASLLGAPGQGAYAAANAFLDGLAQRRRARGLPALSIQWGRWTGPGMAERSSGSSLERSPSPSLERGAALAAFERLLGQALSEPGSLPAAVAVVPPGGQEQTEGAKPPAWLAGLLRAAAPEEREGILSSEIRRAAARVLGMDAARLADPSLPLQELGLDSLMALELRNILGAAVGTPLAATLLFDAPSLAALGRTLSGILGFGQAPSVQENAAEEDEAIRAAEVERLSEDDLDREIAGFAERYGDAGSGPEGEGARPDGPAGPGEEER